MIDGLKPYPAMKDSGVPWLEEVPAHWEIRRLKQICRLEYGDSLVSEVRQNGTVPVFGSNGCVGSHIAGNTRGPCVIVGRKGSFGKVHYSSNPAFAIDTTFFVDGRCSSADIRWLYFLLGWLRLDEVNKDSAVPGLDRGDAYQRLAPFPPISEQIAVVRFLDHINQRIQRYIRAKEKLISLLEEQKKAIIHEAVTGRIDVRSGRPYSAYKPSGVEWLGKVPAHWEVRRLKSSTVNVVDQDIGRQPRENYVALEHVESWTGRVIGNARREAPPDGQLKRFRSGDVLFGKLRPYLAKVTRPSIKGCCVAEFLVLRSHSSELSNGYLELLLRSKPVVDAIQSSTFGAKMPRAEWNFIGTMMIVVPSSSEQTTIVCFLDKAVAGIDNAAARARREMDLLREYRSRLIADVVTGKLDVRGAANALSARPGACDATPDAANGNAANREKRS